MTPDFLRIFGTVAVIAVVALALNFYWHLADLKYPRPR